MAAWRAPRVTWAPATTISWRRRAPHILTVSDRLRSQTQIPGQTGLQSYAVTNVSLPSRAWPGAFGWDLAVQPQSRGARPERPRGGKRDPSGLQNPPCSLHTAGPGQVGSSGWSLEAEASRGSRLLLLCSLPGPLECLVPASFPRRPQAGCRRLGLDPPSR